MLPAGYSISNFYNGYDGSTNIGTNGVPLRKGDRITISGFFKWPEWPDLQNGAYTVDRVGTVYGLNAFILRGDNVGTWFSGSRTGRFGGEQRITSSSGAVFYDPGYDAKIGLATSFIGGGHFVIFKQQNITPTLINNPTPTPVPVNDPPIRLDDPIINNPPTIPTAPPNTPVTPTTPVAPPPLVKRNGTTVTIPFLTSASFKPGTNARANERGKVAFIKAVQAASKASNLNKAQSDQLMADVIKAIKDADLKRRKITPLKGKK
jgi:hypothetical protein